MRRRLRYRPHMCPGSFKSPELGGWMGGHWGRCTVCQQTVRVDEQQLTWAHPK